MAKKALWVWFLKSPYQKKKNKINKIKSLYLYLIHKNGVWIWFLKSPYSYAEIFTGETQC